MTRFFRRFPRTYPRSKKNDDRHRLLRPSRAQDSCRSERCCPPSICKRFQLYSDLALNVVLQNSQRSVLDLATKLEEESF